MEVCGSGAASWAGFRETGRHRHTPSTFPLRAASGPRRGQALDPAESPARTSPRRSTRGRGRRLGRCARGGVYLEDLTEPCSISVCQIWKNAQPVIFEGRPEYVRFAQQPCQRRVTTAAGGPVAQLLLPPLPPPLPEEKPPAFAPLMPLPLLPAVPAPLFTDAACPLPVPPARPLTVCGRPTVRSPTGAGADEIREPETVLPCVIACDGGS